MFIIKYRFLFLAISALAVLISLVSILSFGLKKSIDFTGGARVIVESSILNTETLQSEITKSFPVGKVANVGEGKLKLSLPDLKESDYQTITTNISTLDPNSKVAEFTMIGPSISSEVTTKAILGFILVALAIILFITVMFMGVSYPVSSFKYGLITIVALIHDTIIPAGVFAYLGYAFGVEVDSLFVVALLTILGVSVSDTIVVFDRVRENLKVMKNKAFDEIVGLSLEQSFVRSLATSVSVIAVLFALYLFGPESTKYFSLTLIIGMFVGTYSSLFVASPLLVLASKYWKSKSA